jgi:cytochrome c-type biogenesis protein CcmH/NrfF
MRARIKSFASTLLLWLLPAITAVVGAAFVIATLFVFKLSPPNHPNPKELESTWTS